MFDLLYKFIDKKVTVLYIENGIEKIVKGKLKYVDETRGIIIEDNALIIMGFISNFSAIKKITYYGLPIYKNDNLPPHYGYNPLKLPNNIREKNKQKQKLYMKKTK